MALSPTWPDSCRPIVQHLSRSWLSPGWFVAQMTVYTPSQAERWGVAAGLRLGSNLCVPHVCRCCSQVDARGLYGLTCKLALGRIARHQILSDIVTRALVSAGIPATKELVGLLRSDGKRPDGLTLVPWQSGKPLTWDVTVAHTLTASYVSSTAREAGAAAELAATWKSAKYANLSHLHHLQPIALDTLGSINTSEVSFFQDLGRRISQVSGILGKRPVISRPLQSPVTTKNVVSIPCYFEILSLPRTIQMPSHSSFWF